MVRPVALTLRTRSSTLGATRLERINSAMESQAATSVYDHDSRKGRNRTPLRGRVRSYSVDSRSDNLPTSIRMEQDGYARSPKVDYSTTSCSITTRSSLERQSISTPVSRTSSTSRRQLNSRDPSPVHRRRTTTLQRRGSRDSSPQTIRQTSSRAASSSQNSSGRSSRNSSPVPIRRSSSGRSSRNSSPVPMRRSSSGTSSRNPSPVRRNSSMQRQQQQQQQSRHSSPVAVRRSPSTQSSRHSTPVNSRRTASPQRDRSPSILRRISSRDRSMERRNASPKSRDRSPAMRRREQQQQRAASRSRSRSRQTDGSVGGRSVSSSVLPSSHIPSNNDSNYEEKIELVAMTNEHDQNFVRILVSKTSYQPRMGDGVEVVARSEVPTRSTKSNHWEPPSINCGTIDNSIVSGNTGTSNSTRKSSSFKHERNESRKSASNIVTNERKEEDQIAALKMSETVDRAIDTVDMAINAVNPCGGPPNASPWGTESVPDYKNRRRRSRNNSRSEELFDKYTPTVSRTTRPDNTQEQRLRGNDTNAHNPYAAQPVKRSNSWTEKLRERMAEQKQKKIQKQMDKEAKEQIKRELQIQREREKQEKQRSVRRSNSFGPRSNSFNSADMRKINYVTRSRSDNKIYQKSYEETCRHRDRYNYDEEESLSRASRGNLFEKIKASLSREEARVPVRNVSFVSSDHVDHDDYYSYDGNMSRDTAAIQTMMRHRQGTPLIQGVCDCVAPNLQDVRDLRMVDSDISGSTSEDESSDDSSESSSEYYY